MEDEIVAETRDEGDAGDGGIPEGDNLLKDGDCGAEDCVEVYCSAFSILVSER